MICKDCKWEADQVGEGVYTHEEIAEISSVFHKHFGDLVGHAGCVADGCGCQHREVGSVIIDRSKP